LVNTKTASVGTRSRFWLVLAAAATLALSALYLGRPALATEGDPHKVTICHRTDSQTNPYVVITVDVASVDGDSGNDNGQGDHLLEHTGAVWAGPDTPKEPKWGDIIPPFYEDGSTLTGYPSLNWDDAGQAIFYNDCNPVAQESQAAESQAQESQAEESQAEESQAEQSQAEESQAEQSQAEESQAEGSQGEPEQSVEAGTGTPGQSQSDTALGPKGPGPLSTLLFTLILLTSLGALAYTNVRSVRRRT
jgi:hypothetical protein